RGWPTGSCCCTKAARSLSAPSMRCARRRGCRRRRWRMSFSRCSEARVPRDGVLLRRELAVTFRAPVTWWVAVLSSVLVGHGFVLAVDLFSAASRSVGTSPLIAREMDPLAGLVRPTLGGLYVAVSLLAPLAASRGLSIEKERHTLDSLLIQAGAPGP